MAIALARIRSRAEVGAPLRLPPSRALGRCRATALNEEDSEAHADSWPFAAPTSIPSRRIAAPYGQQFPPSGELAVRASMITKALSVATRGSAAPVHPQLDG
jgi:hypothetical protein